MRAIHGGLPTNADVEAFGLTPEECTSPNDDGYFYNIKHARWFHALWADNWPAIKLYRENASQWRVGANGPSGLDYNVIFHELDRRNLPRDEYDDLMGSIRIIEGEALMQLKPAD